jgi:hypothetical protein
MFPRVHFETMRHSHLQKARAQAQDNRGADMRAHPKEARASRKNLTFGTSAIAVLALSVFLGLITLPPLRAQSSTAAADRPAFDVASVKANKSGSQFSSVNIPIGPGDAYNPTGGLYSGTNVPLVSYMYFAYQLTGNQLMYLLPRLPKWVTADRFDIQARASGNPTKDQMRLMLQSLLADRFKLTVHYETQQLPAFALLR